MDLPLVMAALMNRYGEDILPEEVAYAMEDKATSSTGNAAFAAAAAGCCGYPCWQAWMDLADLRTQIHDDCSIAVRVERHIRGQRDPVGVWMGLRGFGHDDAVLADFVLLNDPTADSDGAVNCTMALADFMRYFTGRAIALRPKQREVAADLPNRVRCDLTRAEDGSYFFEQRGPAGPAAGGFFRLGGLCRPRWRGPRHHSPPHLPPDGAHARGRAALPARTAGRRRPLQRVRGGPDRADAGGGSPSPRAPQARGRACRTPNRTQAPCSPASEPAAQSAFRDRNHNIGRNTLWQKTIITIGREYCTGGNYIAEDVANALGIKLYDKELITMAAKHSGLSEEAVAASEKRRTHSLLYSLYTMGNELPLGDQVFILQSRIIKQLAEEGPCVILGRCGDYVLRERKDVLRVFIYAPVEWRRELAKTDPLVKAHDEKGIKEEIEKTDRNRAAYYNYYTQNRWGDAHNYDLAINAALGRETCVKMILDAVAAKEKTMAE